MDVINAQGTRLEIIPFEYFLEKSASPYFECAREEASTGKIGWLSSKDDTDPTFMRLRRDADSLNIFIEGEECNGLYKEKAGISAPAAGGAGAEVSEDEIPLMHLDGESLAKFTYSMFTPLSEKGKSIDLLYRGLLLYRQDFQHSSLQPIIDTIRPSGNKVLRYKNMGVHFTFTDDKKHHLIAYAKAIVEGVFFTETERLHQINAIISAQLRFIPSSDGSTDHWVTERYYIAAKGEDVEKVKNLMLAQSLEFLDTDTPVDETAGRLAKIQAIMEFRLLTLKPSFFYFYQKTQRFLSEYLSTWGVNNDEATKLLGVYIHKLMGWRSAHESVGKILKKEEENLAHRLDEMCLGKSAEEIISDLKKYNASLDALYALDASRLSILDIYNAYRETYIRERTLAVRVGAFADVMTASLTKVESADEAKSV